MLFMKHSKKKNIIIPGGECIDSKNVYLIASIAGELQKILGEKLNEK